MEKSPTKSGSGKLFWIVGAVFVFQLAAWATWFTIASKNKVAEVPLATYGIAVKLDEKWQITLGERLGKGMQEGKVYDTGSLALDRK